MTISNSVSDASAHSPLAANSTSKTQSPFKAKVTHFATPSNNPVSIFDSVCMSREDIRSHVRQARNNIAPESQNQLALIASRHMLAEIQARSAKHVAIYLTNDGELATQKLIDALWELDINVYLPRVHPFVKGHLLFIRYRPDSVMTVNKFNINEPQLNVGDVIPLHRLDMVITPLVAFDDHGNRIGMGGGFYDRTLADAEPNKPLIIGFAHDIQQVSQVPFDWWDIPLAMVITPTRRLTIS